MLVPFGREAGRCNVPPERFGTLERSRTTRPLLCKPTSKRNEERAKTNRSTVDIIISNSSDKPIYEQIASQMKALIMSGVLAEGAQLPSIRVLANDLRISVITTKRAYADLESQGFIETVQGKGSFVASGNQELVREERLRQVEVALEQAVDAARMAGMSTREMHDMLDLLLDD